MKKKNGFISISIIYSFFIVFLLIMLAMLASYMNKRYLKDKMNTGLPKESICREGDSLKECLINEAIVLQGEITSLTQDEINDGVNEGENGMFLAPDDYTRATGTQSYYYRGEVDNNYVKFGNYIWRVVRVNGNNTYRLIYQGEYDYEANADQSKVKGNDYIQYGVSALSKYNYSSFNSNECAIRGAIANISQDLSDRAAEKVDASCDSKCEAKYWLATSEALCKLGCRLDEASANSAEKIADYYDDKNEKECEKPDENWGAHLLHNIGYMNNESALLYRYDSKYDNQDSSELKTYIDNWYKNAGLDANMLSQSTIFCGDKNRTKCTDENGLFKNCSEDSESEESGFLTNLINKTATLYQKSERYYYSGWERIVNQNNAASFVCSDTGQIATNAKNKVLNLSRYNVSNDLSSTTNNLLYEYDNSPYSLVLGTKTREKSNAINYYYNNANSYYIDRSNQKQSFKPYNLKYVYDSTSKDKPLYYTSVIFNDSFSYNATYEYIGNGDLDYPIALLSADEAVMAGLTYNKENNKNDLGSKSYLLDYAQNDEYFWTMTLSYTDYSSIANRLGAYYFAVKQTGESEGRLVQFNDYPKSSLTTKLYDSTGKNIDDVLYGNIGAYVRPVINLDYSVVKCDGTGTAEDPYVIGQNKYNDSGTYIGNTCNE